MQERYLGDVHDFYKFLFLKYLSKKLKKKIGLNWYLISPKLLGANEEKKKDGENRNYLKKKEICKLDNKISEEFIKIVDIKKRNIADFTNRTHLKSHIKFYNKQITSERESWFQESVDFFKNNEIIFLDPDNGLLKKENKRNSLKHLLIDEIDKYLSHGKIIIFTQFQSYNKNHLNYLKEIKNFLNSKNLRISLPIVRNRTSPNTFFITLGNQKNLKKKKIFEILQMYNDEIHKTIELVTI